ncbi:MAG TPA: fimbrial protein [Scandinavium sp.]|jgi:type 1 fimbria pilin
MKKILFLLLLFVATQHTAYACYYFSGSNAPAAINVDLGSITIPNDYTTPVGSVIAIKSGLISSFGGVLPSFSCGTNANPGSPGTNPAANTSILASGDGSATTNAIYATNIQGIGVKLYYFTASAYQNEPTTPTQTYISIPILIAHSYSSIYLNPNASIKVELIKTASFSQVASGQVNYASSSFLRTADNGFNLANLSVSATINTASCTVTEASKSLSVPLGNIQAHSIPSVGSVADSHNFSIDMTCNAGVGVSVKINANEDSNISGQGVIALTAATDGNATASGVGVQLLYNNSPIPLNQNLAVGQADLGAFKIPLIARYYRTRNTVTPGVANATATYTLTYN